MRAMTCYVLDLRQVDAERNQEYVIECNLQQCRTYCIKKYLLTHSHTWTIRIRPFNIQPILRIISQG